MLRHVLMFRLSASATPEQRRLLAEQFHVMQQRIDELLALSCGPNAGLAPPEMRNPDFVAIMDFADEAAWRRYLAHPAHDEFAERYLIPINEQTIGVQFYTDEPPAPVPGG